MDINVYGRNDIRRKQLCGLLYIVYYPIVVGKNGSLLELLDVTPNSLALNIVILSFFYNFLLY